MGCGCREVRGWQQNGFLFGATGNGLQLCTNPQLVELRTDHKQPWIDLQGGCLCLIWWYGLQEFASHDFWLGMAISRTFR